jgi:hypothetical protein
LALASQAKAFPKRRPTPDGENNTDYRAFPTFCGRVAGEFLGRCAGAGAAGGAEIFSATERAAARPVHGEPALPTVGTAERLSQRILRAELRNPLRSAALAHCPQPQAGVSARGDEEVSAPGGRGHDNDPRSLSARHLHPASGPGGGHADGRNGKPANRVTHHPFAGRNGAPVSSGAVERRLRLFVFTE